MLDENLPTFRFRPSTDSPTSTTLYLTQGGSDPAPAFLLRRPDPSLPASRNKYAAALSDPSFHSVIYAEVLVEPEWRAPSPPPAGSPPAPHVPITPDSVSLQLYNPDQTVVLKHAAGGWNRSESWEFEMPERTFRLPSASRLDRDSADGPAAAPGSGASVVFRWKKDGKLSRDMTCYIVGQSLDGKKSKEPDITVAMFGHGKGDACAVTLYEPNMRRVDIEDRKGLEVVLLLGAEVIRSLYLNTKGDPFNISASAPGAPNTAGAKASGAANVAGAGRGRDSRPQQAAAAAIPVMSGAVGAPAAQKNSAAPRPAANASASRSRSRERRDREEQDRIRKMLKEEEASEKRRREEEVEKETERLRSLYGVPASGAAAPQPQPPQPPPAAGAGGNRPALPPRPVAQSPTNLAPGVPPSLPQRPVSAGPYGYSNVTPPPQSQGQGQGQHTGGGGGASSHLKKAEGFVSGLFRAEREREEERRKKKVAKKRSVHF
ncbi:uncharacterized protein DNG_05736 [Cephalotrichum gorgonifer]|uniref:Uncharacterized protein n=1 Tax=Cephalotrichum gorgonifer TaxID=2041049 RepID=A0AAE8N1C6_9PEZI|nr:uncharacterized protein DNG_05736 [Cephalotrichum gorgonifer]